MEVSVEMIQDYLRKRGIQTLDTTQWGRRFLDVRCYYPGAVKKDAYLYFCKKRPSASDELDGLFAIWPVREEEFKKSGEEPAGICCICEEEKLLESVMDCFSYFREWYFKMNEALLNGEGLQKLAEIGCRMFGNPVIVDDSSFRVLAFARGSDWKLTDRESLFLMKNGYHSPEYIDLITEHPIFLKNMNYNMEPFVHHYEFLEHQSIYCPIRYKKRIAGFLTIVGFTGGFTKGQLHEAKLFAGMLARAIGLSDSFHMQNRPDDNILLNFIKGNITDEDLIGVCIHKSGLLEEESYYSVYLAPIMESDSNYFVLTRMVDLMKERIHKSKILLEENQIIMIVNERQMPRAKLEQILEEWVFSHKFTVGFSISFQDLRKLPYFHRQAFRSVFWGQKLFPKEHVFFYGKIMLYDILSREMDQLEKAALKHPALGILKEQDREKKSELRKTLLSYLNHNGNSIATAKELTIHKNSLYYRLGQIKELTGLDLEDGMVCEYLRVSFILEEIEGKNIEIGKA